MLLRRVVLSVMAVFPCVSLKSDDNGAMPWRTLLDWPSRTLASASRPEIDGLRRQHQAHRATN
jgi:hypothetical protein